MIINIYYSKETKFKLDQICKKYEVSKSTIAVNLLFYFTKYLMQEGNKDLIAKLGKEYLNYPKGEKTSIKPRLDPLNNGYYENLTKAYTNMINIYVNKDIKKYLTAANTQNFYNEMNNILQKTTEPNWDYNKFIRSIKRYERKKRRIFRKVNK